MITERAVAMLLLENTAHNLGALNTYDIKWSLTENKDGGKINAGAWNEETPAFLVQRLEKSGASNLHIKIKGITAADTHHLMRAGYVGGYLAYFVSNYNIEVHLVFAPPTTTLELPAEIVGIIKEYLGEITTPRVVLSAASCPANIFHYNCDNPARATIWYLTERGAPECKIGDPMNYI